MVETLAMECSSTSSSSTTTNSSSIPMNTSTRNELHESSQVSSGSFGGDTDNNSNIIDNDSLKESSMASPSPSSSPLKHLHEFDVENNSGDNNTPNVSCGTNSPEIIHAETQKHNNEEAQQDVDNEDRVDKEIIKPEQNGQTPKEDDEDVMEGHKASSAGVSKDEVQDNLSAPEEDSESTFVVKMRKSRDVVSGSSSSGDTEIHHREERLLKKRLESHYSTSTMHSSQSIIFPTGDDFCVTTSTKNDTVRITGYLEKRSKMLGWKKFWFVLDGRLLTYYKSKTDYDGLSACCGSINLGIASTVRPIQIRGCKGYPMQIVTRSQVYYLRSLDKQTLEQWLIAIQETTSAPLTISSPVWADPGAQFYRYSFAALSNSNSNWSLNDSCDDITESLKQLPKNFYLKGGVGCGSTASTNPSNLYKCHSFASLQSTSSYNTLSMKNALAKLKNSNILRRDKKESTIRESVRHASSMLTLNSSVQATELKNELARKLSIGTTQGESVKPSVTASKNKLDLPFLRDPTKISNKNLSGDESHHYDEIVDFETTYENYVPSESEISTPEKESFDFQPPSTTDSNHNQSTGHEADSEIYESVENIDDEPWAKMEGNETLKKNIINSNRHSNVSSTFSDSTLKRQDSADSSSPSHKELPAIPDRDPPLTFDQLRKKFSIDSDTSCSSHGEITDKEKKKSKKKSIGGFFSKMFNRDKNKRSKTLKEQPPLVITGPLDLRSLHHDPEQSPAHRPTNLPIEEAQTSETTLKRPPQHPVSFKPAFNNEIVMDELKATVGRLSRSPSGDGNASSLEKKRPSFRKIPISSKLGIVKDELIEEKFCATQHVEKSEVQPQKSRMDSARYTPSEERDTFESEVVQRRRPSQSEEFQEKLAKFNRLSERLSSSFNAALNPVAFFPSVGILGRSSSFKVKKNNYNDEELPPLPPKKKNNPEMEYQLYDTPTNNRPILMKKNSAPDIIFSSSRSSSGAESGTDGSNLDNVFVEILSPPPIPPKSKSMSPQPEAFRTACATVQEETASKYEDSRNSLNSLLSNQADSPENLASQSQKIIEDGASLTETIPTQLQSSQKTPLQSKVSAGSEQIDLATFLAESEHTPPEKVTSSKPNDASPKSPEVDSPQDDKPEPKETKEITEFKKEPNPETNSIYQNLRFATVNTLEFETVEEEETADEISEMYDDFPTEFTTPVPLFNPGLYANADLIDASESDFIDDEERDEFDEDAMDSPSRSAQSDKLRDPVRHSGIDQLQAFLSLDSAGITENIYDTPEADLSINQPHSLPDFPMKSISRTGAVSRLGHSSAIDQLQKIVRSRSDV